MPFKKNKGACCSRYILAALQIEQQLNFHNFPFMKSQCSIEALYIEFSHIQLWSEVETEERMPCADSFLKPGS